MTIKRELFTNAAETLLATTVNSSITTVVVANGSTFPLANFRILVELELMFCTSRSSNTLTVVRGIEGTTGASHTSGVAVNHLITAGSLTAIKADLFATMGHGRPPTSGNTYGDEFDDENFSGWTSVVPGSPTITPVEQDKFMSILHPGGGSTNNIFHSYMKSCGSLSAGDWISMTFRQWMGNSNYPQVTLWFADGATYGAGNQVGYAFSPNESQLVIRANTNYNNQTAFNGGGPGSTNNLTTLGYDMSLKLVYQGSNTYDGYWSLDGVNWTQSHTGTSCGSFTPNYCGFGYTPWGCAYPSVASFRNFRTSF